VSPVTVEKDATTRGSLSTLTPKQPAHRPQKPLGSEKRVSRTGKVHFVSRQRQRRRHLVALLGYRPRQPPRKPRTTKGRYRWVSAAEREQIAILTALGRSGRAIAIIMRRDRRTVDRWRQRLQTAAVINGANVYRPGQA
jgi:hypothetical protein